MVPISRDASVLTDDRRHEVVCLASWGGHRLGASDGKRRPSPRPRISVCPCGWTEGSVQLEYVTWVCGGHLTLQSLVSSSPHVEWFPASLPAGGILLGQGSDTCCPVLPPSGLASRGGSACLGLWVHSVTSLSGRSVAHLEQFEQFPSVCTCACEAQPQASSAGAHMPGAGCSPVWPPMLVHEPWAPRSPCVSARPPGTHNTGDCVSKDISPTSVTSLPVGNAVKWEPE